MPSIEEFSKRKKVKFKKTSFRPWNYDEDLLTGNSSSILEKDNASSKVTNKESNGNQTVTNKEPKSNPKIINKESNSNQIVINKESKSNLNGNQKISNYSENQDYTIAIYKLSGLQKSLFFYIIDRTEIKGNLQTGPISINSFTELTKTTVKTIKTALQRLVEKNLIIKNPNKIKRGKGGFRYYSVDKEIKSTALEIKRIENIPYALNALKSNQKVVQTVTKTDYSNSYYNNKELTTIPNCWQRINFEPLKDIGFSETQLMQLCEKNLNTPEIVQESINHFAFGLENNEKTKSYKEPLNTIMGVLRKGRGWVESNYESPQDRTLRELTERKRLEKEKRIERLRELFNLSFDEWFSELSNEEGTKIFMQVGPSGMNAKYDRGSKMVRAMLRKYFQDSIWPEKVEEYGIVELDYEL